MNPHRLTWGAAYDFPFAQVIGIATLSGFTLLILREGRVPAIPWRRESISLLFLWIIFAISTHFAINPEEAWPEFTEISKILLMTFITMALIDDKDKYRYLLLVIAVSLGFFGVKGGLFSIATGGQHKVWGPNDSFIADNTALGLALNMILPFLFYLSKTEGSPLFSRMFKYSFYLTTLAVMFTYSRGAALGLAAIFLILFLQSSLSGKILGALAIIIAAPFIINSIPEKFYNRIESISSYESDGSATSRIEAWKAAWNLALDRPLIGGGFNAINDKRVFQRYNPNPHFERKGAHRSGVHSIYFEVLSENGFLGFGLFLALIISSFFTLRKIRKMSRAFGLRDNVYYSYMLEASLFSYCVSGAFLEFASFDLFYQIIALIVILYSITEKSIQSTQNAHNDSYTSAESRALSDS